jgi:hypothetical protein
MTIICEKCLIRGFSHQWRGLRQAGKSREWPLQIRRQKQTGDIGRDQHHPAKSGTQAHISARARDKHEEPAPTAFTHVACVWLLCAGRWERGRGYLRWSACAGGGAHAFVGQNCGAAGASWPIKPGSVFRFPSATAVHPGRGLLRASRTRQCAVAVRTFGTVTT